MIVMAQRHLPFQFHSNYADVVIGDLALFDHRVRHLNFTVCGRR